MRGRTYEEIAFGEPNVDALPGGALLKLLLNFGDALLDDGDRVIVHRGVFGLEAAGYARGGGRRGGTVGSVADPESARLPRGMTRSVAFGERCEAERGRRGLVHSARAILCARGRLAFAFFEDLIQNMHGLGTRWRVRAWRQGRRRRGVRGRQV